MFKARVCFRFRQKKGELLPCGKGVQWTALKQWCPDAGVGQRQRASGDERNIESRKDQKTQKKRGAAPLRQRCPVDSFEAVVP